MCVRAHSREGVFVMLRGGILPAVRQIVTSRMLSHYYFHLYLGSAVRQRDQVAGYGGTVNHH